MKKNKLFNLSNGKSVTVKKLIKIILEVTKIKNYKIVQCKNTQGDSFRYSASSNYLKLNFNNYKFISLKKGISLFFKWINEIPIQNNLKNYHPFRIKKNNCI